MWTAILIYVLFKCMCADLMCACAAKVEPPSLLIEFFSVPTCRGESDFQFWPVTASGSMLDWTLRDQDENHTGF